MIFKEIFCCFIFRIFLIVNSNLYTLSLLILIYDLIGIVQLILHDKKVNFFEVKKCSY